jgi:hypothetical protein
MKYNVLFIGCKPKGLDEIWGGSVATAYAYLKSFENSDKYNIIPVARDGIKTYDIIKSVLNKFEYDILHVDETSILNLMYNGGFEVPDVIGPVTRSPIKTYGKTWKSDYTEEYFYKAKVIRLNRSEEWLYKGRLDYTDKVHFINHGIHTELLKPSNNKNKNLILWAGDSERGAKGYEMWLDKKIC